MESTTHPARWYSPTDDGRLLCELCPRACQLRPGDRGFCFVRQNIDGQMVLDTYGKSTGFCIDPIEKKPLNHFYPGTPILSFGTAGCNLGCKFCQNWEISKSREVARLSDTASPEAIARTAKELGCHAVAFTYNDPVIWAEYALDTAVEVRRQGLKSVAVTAGYITPQARGEFFDGMDGANIDLKGFTEDFYFKTTASHLEPVLDTISYACNETNCWVELTNLLIPNANDDLDDLKRMCDWIVEKIGPFVPVHFTAFHPDFRMRDRVATSHESLIAAYELARNRGIKYAYVGNVHDVARQSTYCHQCHGLLIERDWYALGRYHLKQDRCGYCNAVVPGRYLSASGTWGQRRQPIRISSHLVTTLRSEKVMNVPSIAETKLSDWPETDCVKIHQAASQAVATAVHGSPSGSFTENLGDLAERPIQGMYVTLKRGSTLRGCCGSQGTTRRLVDCLTDSAYRTAREDPRMPPIAAAELPFLQLGVSILGPSHRVTTSGDDRLKEVQVGRHGLRIQFGQKAGLLLPSVATEYGWNSRQFLDAVCRKAGLPSGTWRRDDVDLQIFDGRSYTAPIALPNSTIHESPPVTSTDLRGLVDWIRQNLVAFRTGATPFYYAYGTSDSNILGVALIVSHAQFRNPLKWLHLSLRDYVPLQSTLYRLTEQIAASTPGNPEEWNIDLAVMTSAVHHGSVPEADLRGIESRLRGIVLTDGRRWGVVFDSNQAAQVSVDQARKLESFRIEPTQVYSMVFASTVNSMFVSIAPAAQSDFVSRPPAVSGTFYPGNDNERDALVDSFLDLMPSIHQQPVSAIMVPHAGLKYSGRIATAVWRQVKLPQDVLIIGPKHTADGVDWAVAPHDHWYISRQASIQGNVDLAKSLVQAVPAFQLDALAHAREHGIETQLPLLYRIASQTRVTAIAMHGGSLGELKETAKLLAKWLQGLDSPPLLVISSDLNHFADLEENMRRDRLALTAMESLDPEALLRVCESESISMCGVIPAVLVMLTLRELGTPMQYVEVAYGTSADTTGARDRVVGYAGVLL